MAVVVWVAIVVVWVAVVVVWIAVDRGGGTFFSKFCGADAVWYFLLHHVLACGDWYTMQVSYNAAFCIAGLYDSSTKHVWQASTVSTFGQTLRWV